MMRLLSAQPPRPGPAMTNLVCFNRLLALTLCAATILPVARAAEPGAPVPGAPVPGASVVDAANVVFVLDASGSMAERMPGTRESKMQVATGALLSVARQLPDDTRVGVLVFSGVGKADDWLHPLEPLDAGRLEAALRRLRPSAGTPLGEYIRVAAERLLERRAAQGGYGAFRLIVVTDGEAGDPELVERYAPAAMARGLTMQVIGVAMSSDHSLARQVHAYRSANDAGSLEAALSASVAEIRPRGGGTAGEDDFAVIAPLPAGAAGAMLTALRESGNAPLEEGAAAGGAGVAPSGRPSGTPNPQAAPGPVGGVDVEGFSFGGCWVCPVIALVGVMMLLRALNKASRRRG